MSDGIDSIASGDSRLHLGIRTLEAGLEVLGEAAKDVRPGRLHRSASTSMAAGPPGVLSRGPG